MLFLTLGIGVIHHHTHLHVARALGQPRHGFLDHAAAGHPTFVFYPAHVANHHRYKHGPDDQARTYRFGGDTNHLWGYLIHPVQAVWVLYPLFFTWLGRLRRHWPGAWRYCMAQYGAWLGLWAGLLALNPAKALVFVIVPQLHGLHWLLATNYLQHAHADGGPGRGAALSYARNFEGLLNPLLFNIGLHTAHHEHSRAHWAELTELHYGRYRDQVPAALNEGGLVPMFRVFVLVGRRCADAGLRQHDPGMDGQHPMETLSGILRRRRVGHPGVRAGRGNGRTRQRPGGGQRAALAPVQALALRRARLCDADFDALPALDAVRRRRRAAAG